MIKIQNKLLVPYITAFIASFCIMVLELTAGRIIARYLGASLYTWTSVIGIVLAGIAVGSYAGGLIADRFSPSRTLSILFILASAGCAVIPGLNRIVGSWDVLLLLDWPMRVTLHVTFTFLLPSLILGMIGPVVAKFALDQGLSTGKTVGNVYAWGAAGSIIGTFLTGFFLIAKMGTLSVVWAVAGVLAIMGILYARRFWLSYAWASLLILLIIFSVSTQGWAYVVGQRLALREETNPAIIYETESQYSYIKVERSANSPNIRKLILDQLVNSVIQIADNSPDNIQNLYSYQEVYEAITRCFARDKRYLNTLFIGGGGYVFPRYIEKHWPGSRIDVAEIDPVVTSAAIQAFGLSRESSIQIHHLDARNYVDNLIRRKLQGQEIMVFDFVYGDAINNLSVPYQLTTYEFNEKIKGILAPGGVYMINLVDSLSSGGEFLGAVFRTLRRSFPYVYVYPAKESNVREGLNNTYVLAGALAEINFEELTRAGFSGSPLEKSQLDRLEKRSGGLILTDNYAPVESLLRPVVREQGDYAAFFKLMNLGNLLAQKGRLKQAIKCYYKGLEINPDFAEGHNNLANTLARQGRFDNAVAYYQKALELSPGFTQARYNLAASLISLGKVDEAIEQYNIVLEADPGFAEAHNSLGNILAQQARFKEAMEHYEAALKIKPDYPQVYNNMALVLVNQGRIEEAVSCYRKALEIDSNYEIARSNLDKIINITHSRQEKGHITEGI